MGNVELINKKGVEVLNKQRDDGPRNQKSNDECLQQEKESGEDP